MSALNTAAQKSHITQALRLERDVSSATSQTQALEAAIEVVEHYMKALNLATVQKDKQALDAKCQEWLTRAEKIKGAKDWQSAARVHSTGESGLRHPSSTRKLTTREEIILLEGAKLNNFVFPPWTHPPAPSEFKLERGKEPFTDHPELHLSNVQRQLFDGWKRPHELLAKINERTGHTLTPVMSPREKTDLVQDMLTDCSVVASLCATTSRTERGLSKGYLPVAFPCESGQTEISPAGRYIFRFYFNGCFRKVIVDDRLPSSKTSRSLHVVDRNNPDFLWPALVEKAYLKLRGGYDFPGSNSGTDLWVLTGWIPEQIFLHHEDVTSDDLWRRLYRSFCHGDVLLTIGTGKLTEREQTEVGLVSEHDYSILALKESKGRRQMLVKNPWAGADMVHQDIETALDSVELTHDQPSFAPGSFWMDCDKVLQNFENLYLNWNPGLFRYREDIHFPWDLTSGRGVAGCFVKNPQFSVSTKSGGTVWLLLGKHFQTIKHRGNIDDAPDSAVEHEEPGFISIYIFNTDGKRVSLSDGALHRGPYVDSPNTLMRLEMHPNTTYTAVISEQSLPSSNQNFTLSALSTAPVQIAPAQNKYKYVTKVQGSWTGSMAGGNAESPRYPQNPQFAMKVSSATDVSLLLECPETEIATHIKLFWSNGNRVARVRSRDIITDSGDYRRGGCLAEKQTLDEGIYTIVCSTFAPDQLGRFTLWISSSYPCKVDPLAPEAAGRLASISDIGILPPGSDRMLAPLRVPRLTRIKLIARSRQSLIGNHPVGPSPVLMTVELGQGPYKEILASSEDGHHSDAISGVRVSDFDLQPGLENQGGVWIVLERIGGPGGQVEDHFEVEALAEERVDFGEWIVEDA
ncbi:calpain-like protease PalBory [Aspergillus candidus]|uniref:Cytosolic Ca2+-dependent cysteine protease n=1 Tax=Aspergillus candidus TaxID=41067 RepID=A0A2I2F9C6_ASPCN|nr:cytosolic Ca2+-dependent cysteine protease [Aspergillus candidus]PLB37237.1 cytosolic Ca2+-dependent cysteine protease [Aspergillus candidus]